ncbi:MAG: hypothetical protein KAI17_18025 [Thiotrichaceae bacterium]|nr:hypothetical protein [Thiotrichaceae bacterium]
MSWRIVLPCLALSLTLVTYSFALFAEADGPDYWQVYDVKKNDVLNMRDKADFNAQKTGEIPYDAQCVRNMGCNGGLTFNEFTTLSDSEKQQRLKQRPRWCRVSYGETTGWVEGRYLREGVCPESANASRHDVIIKDVDSSINPYNNTYSIEKEKVVLHNGQARVTIPGSAAVILTRVIHKPVYADLDDDKTKEAVTILMQQTGGTGTFYYLVVADDGDKIIESYFLGDRIKIVSVKVVDNIIIVEYFERERGQPMASKPTVKVSKKFKLDGKKIVVSLQ